jgi:hypothetical protein
MIEVLFVIAVAALLTAGALLFCLRNHWNDSRFQITPNKKNLAEARFFSQMKMLI